MTSASQREFDFDIVSLNKRIAALRPKSLQTLFRGLLSAAFHEPELVKEIHPDGRVELLASVATVAFWSTVETRTIQRSKLKHADMVTHLPGANFTEGWEFLLTDVLPEQYIRWFIEHWEFAKCHPDKKHHPPRQKAECHPDKKQNVTPTFSNLSSICFQLKTASLAELAQSLESLGIAARGDDWQTFQADDSALTNPEAVAAIARSIAGNESESRRVFVAAVVAQSKDRPWNYFRSLLTSGNYLTTNASKPQIRIAETMQQLTNGTDAAAIVPLSADEAWVKVLSAIRQFDYMHQMEQLKQELGPEICGAVRTAGGFSKIATTDTHFQHSNRRAFVDAWNAGQSTTAMMAPNL